MGSSGATAEAAKTASRREWPEASSSFWRQLVFGYMDEVLALGSQRHKVDDSLHGEDLPAVSAAESSEALLRQLDETSRLVSVGRGAMGAAAFWQAYTATGQILEPLLLRFLVVSAGAGGSRRAALVAACLIGVNSFGKAFAQQRQLHLATRAGQRVRGAAIAAVYREALRGAGGSSGAVATLVGVDATKLFECCLDLHLAWSAPLQVVAVSALLAYLVGGLAAFAGIACLVAVLPAVHCVMQKLIALRRQRAPITEARVAEVSEVIAGIRVTKFGGWEPLWEERWARVRRRETRYTRREMFWLGLSLLCVVMSPVLATIATVTTHQLTDREARITPADAFTVVSLIAAVRFPINKLGSLIGQLAQAWRALDRITAFTTRGGDAKARDEPDAEELVPLQHAAKPGAADEEENVLTVRRGGFARRQGGREASFAVGRASRLELRVASGETVVVVGEVGSGKTSLVEGLLGYVPPLDESTSVSVRPDAVVAFAPQHACVLNATLRENVVFGRPFDAARYELALEASQLAADVDSFPAGDLTEIGERGVTLSGGQKARVALARVVFADPDLAVLDDPFSALDAKTARLVADGLLGGALRRAAIVLVTHAVHLAPRATTTVVLDASGDVVFAGPWAAAAADPAATRALRPLLAASRLDDHGPTSAAPPTEATKTTRRSDAELRAAASAELVSRERREIGTASLSTWFAWCRAAGGTTFLGVQVVALFLDRVFYVATEYWLARWADARDSGATVFGQSFPSQREGLDAQWRWARVYLCLGAASTFFCFCRTQWAFFCGVTAAKKLYDAASARVLAAPLDWFERTPTGRVVSRFSYDTEQVDVVLTQKAAMLMISIGWAVAGACVMLALSRGAMALALLPVAVAFFRLQDYYRRSSVDLQRLDAVSRSPLQAALVEALEASPSIRAFRVEHFFEAKFAALLDANLEAMLCWTAAQRWIGLRLDLLAAAVATFAAFLVATLRDRLRLSESFSGMLMVWAFQLTITFTFLITTHAESENAVTSVERLDERPPDEFFRAHAARPLLDDAWPAAGDLVFDAVSFRYRPGLPLALDRLSFRVPPASRCAVVGRSGAGKSSILVALFRLSPLAAGDVRVDGLPLSQLDLATLRRRLGTVIAQDPVLFSGTLRRTLDPFEAHPDDAVARALALVMPAPLPLDTPVAANGANFSVGERQLLALARALLDAPRLLVLDEASSSLDDATDLRIQALLRDLPQLQRTTVLCVAHRLRTIIDFDLVAVMDKGRCLEFDHPAALAAAPHSAFSALLDATGPETAASLRAAAAAAAASAKAA